MADPITDAAGEQSFSAFVFGKVTLQSSGEPLADAEIRVGLHGARHRMRTITTVHTNADGRYEVPLTWSPAKNPTGTIQCRHPSASFQCFPVSGDEKWDYGYVLSDGDRIEMDLELADGYSLDLTVVDESGQPVPEAMACVIVTDDRSCFWPFYDQVRPHNKDRDAMVPRTDAAGQAHLVGLGFQYRADDRVVIAVRHDNFVEPLIQRPETLPREDHLASLTVQLDRGLSLSGRVISADGEPPIEGAEVAAYLATNEDDECPPCHPIVKDATTDADGRFELLGLRARDHRLRVEHTDYTSQWIDLSVDAATEQLTVSLQPGREVSGKVLDCEGQPVAEATVEALAAGDYPLRPDRVKTVKTDTDGQFHMGGLPDGSQLWLLAEKDRFSGGFFGFVLLEDRERDVLIDGRRLVEVTGRVIATDTNEPFAERVWCQVWAVTSAGRELIGTDTGQEADGRFTALLPPDGTYRLRLARQGTPGGSSFYALHDIEMAGGEPRQLGDVPVSRPCEVRFHVVDDKTGDPVANILIEASPRRMEWNFSTAADTDEQGEATVGGLPPGETAMAIRTKGYEEWQDIESYVLPVEETVEVRLKRSDEPME
jgi:5-hydroxyisourate hydrolase-like protein (transthyretin family)